MQEMKSLLPEVSIDSETKSSDKRLFVEKQVDWFNEDEGSLNQADGIDCPICKNKGQIAVLKQSEGYSVPVMYLTPCECVKQRKTIKYAKDSGMGNLLKCRVKEFVASEPWQRDIKALVVDYTTNNEGEWLCLLGQSGAGKTHLCSAVANALLNKGLEVRYTVWGIMTKELKQDMYSSTGQRKMLGELQRVPVLYIDDLFKGSYNDQDVTLMFDILNYRYNNNLVTLITSEHLLDGLAKMDTAIAGRIKERCGKFLFQMTGESKNFRFKQS